MSHFQHIMFPSRGMEFSEDIQKNFKTRTLDVDPTLFGQSLFQTPIANRSSSSADSISPESYYGSPIQNADYYNTRSRPQTSKNIYETPRQSYESPLLLYRQDTFIPSICEPTFDQILDTSMYETFQTPAHSHQIFETPLPSRHQQPIIGRKILGRNHLNSEPKIMEQESGWQEITQIQGSQKNYELFPADKGFQFSTPTKTQNQFSSSTSPTFAPKPTNFPLNTQSKFTAPYNPVLNAENDITQSKMCTFCRKNGETPLVYMKHCVKEKRGNRFVVTCPILRSHVCPVCNLSGDDAHTLTYCPILRKTNDGKPLTSTTITLKNTRIKSNGRRRY